MNQHFPDVLVDIIYNFYKLKLCCFLIMENNDEAILLHENIVLCTTRNVNLSLNLIFFLINH